MMTDKEYNSMRETLVQIVRRWPSLSLEVPDDILIEAGLLSEEINELRKLTKISTNRKELA